MANTNEEPNETRKKIREERCQGVRERETERRVTGYEVKREWGADTAGGVAAGRKERVALRIPVVLPLAMLEASEGTGGGFVVS
ncbi:hypothetical protein PIB30_069346 [Stylosanthes scabra]|uniref:Uncharacterized protein n=1 Tax=Stylosanthes scabra TaxID=79078 RepID=A0ABU6WRH8_9FABA|nr:hypothetical protein [Stylosanthes scabra]